MKRIIIAIFILVSCIMASAQQDSTIIKVEPYAWKLISPLGLHEPTTIDTALYNYYQLSVPSEVTPAYATTGNLGAEGETLLFFERQDRSDFFFRDGISAWIPSISTMKFYNTPAPMTLLSYNTGGGRENSQERLKATFSGNANSKTQIGALVDYIYSKGSYNYQAAKGLIWGFSGSYMGDRYEMQAYFNSYNLLNKENGGITDDRYITDPAEIQGGSTSVDTKSIPTFLTAAHTRNKGEEFYINNRYKVGYYHEEEINDTTVKRTYIPVSSFIWTLNYKGGEHNFRNTAPGEAENYWKNTYLNASGTNDWTSYWSLSNTIGISLLEGFHKYAKAGLAAYATHEIRKYKQANDPVNRADTLPDVLTPYPIPSIVPNKASENRFWVGAQLTKQQGTLLRYNATAQFGVAGEAIGDVNVSGDISTRFKLWGDTVTITGYGHFKNEEAPYLMKHFVSNHFIWDNDFGKIRRFRIGGKLDIPHTNTFMNVGVENLQNYVYFNNECLPTQHSGSVQVLSASLNQNFKFGILHWNNKLTYQKSSEEAVIPIPDFSVYSNLFILFKIAKVLDVQLGVDCDYYTKYKSVNYQPALGCFYNQNEIEVGNYPFMNAYINMKLGKTRFYVMFSHVNQGLTGENYFSMPHYPLNPRRFQMGLSVDFTN